MHRPELLAPAGGLEQLRAALAAGADAVYVGLKRFSMRARATNFDADELAEGVELARRVGARVYATVNTLVFDDEWDELLATVRMALDARVAALIVADPGLVMALHRVCPDLELHASTQMTVHHPGQLAPLRAMGVTRVVVAREMELAALRVLCAEATRRGLGIEVFGHGALCVAYSGQCLAGALLAGRSGNRGACPQLCRFPYRTPDGARLHSHPLSLRDLSTLPRLHLLVEAGIASLKIEGRLKGADYVYDVTRVYRRALDDIAAGRPVPLDELMPILEKAFNRGFTGGGLAGELAVQATTEGTPNRQFPAAGVVVAVDGRRARVTLSDPERMPVPGDCLLFRDGMGNDRCSGYVTTVFDPVGTRAEVGLRGLSVADLSGAKGLQTCLATEPTELREVRQRIAAWQPPPLPLTLQVRQDEQGHVVVTAEAPGRRTAIERSRMPAEPARGRALDDELAGRYLGRLGGTEFTLAGLDVDLPPRTFVPPAELNRMRRALVDGLVEALAPPLHVSSWPPCDGTVPTNARRLAVNCRDLATARLAMAAGASRLYLPPDERLLEDLGAVERWVATPAITPPAAFDRLTSWLEDHRELYTGVLAGNLGIGAWCRHAAVPFWADGSWNGANGRSVAAFAALGASGVTWAWEVEPARLKLPTSIPTEFIVVGRPPLFPVALRDLASRTDHLIDHEGRRLVVEGWQHAEGATVYGPWFVRLADIDRLPTAVTWLRCDALPAADDDCVEALSALATVVGQRPQRMTAPPQV